MGLVLGYENVFAEGKKSKVIKSGDVLESRLGPQVKTGFDFISRYLGFQDKSNNDFYNMVIGSSLNKLVSIEKEGKLSDTIEDKCYYWALDEGSNQEKIPVDLPIISPDFFNLLADEYLIPKDRILNFVISFFCQSFVDSYNEIENGHKFEFPGKKETQKRAMTQGDQTLLSLIKDINYIKGITQSRIINLNSDVYLKNHIDAAKKGFLV